MAKYATLKVAIDEIITTNGNYEISGEDVRETLKAIVDSLGANYQLVGFALPTTDPGTPDQNVAYLAGPGTYPNFGPTTVEKGQIGLFKYNGNWSYETIDSGVYLEYEEYPGGDAFEWTFYDSENPDGLTIKIAKTVSDLGNDPNVAISQWWAAQTERKINVLGGYTISIDSLTTSPQTLGLFKAIQTGQIIDSITGANKLIFGTDGGGSVTVNASDLPYKATANLINVRTESGTANNVSIVVRGINDILPAYININEIANHPGAYASAAAALSDVPALYRRKGVKVIYFDDVQQLWIEMVCQDDAGVNWWTDVENNWVIEGSIETKIATATGGQQLRIAGEKRGNLDDVLNVNVWNERTNAYDSAALARAAVPANKRKLGAIITYLLNDGWFIDQFIGSSTSGWGTAENWKVIGRVDVSQNTETKVKTLNIGDKGTTLFNIQCFTKISGYLKSSDGSLGTSSMFDVSDYISVNEGDIISVSGWGGNYTIGVVVGYDINQQFISTLLAGNGQENNQYKNELVTIPSGISYIRVCIANDTHYSYTNDDIHFVIKDASKQGLKGYSFIGIAEPNTIPVNDEMVYYIAYENGVYNNFGSSFTLPIGAYAIIKNKGGWTVDIISLSDNIGEQLVFAQHNCALRSTGVTETGYSDSDVTPLIQVGEGDILIVECYTGLSQTWATCVGIDANNDATLLIPGFDSHTKVASILIPSGIKYIIVYGVNNLHPNYKKRYATIIRKNVRPNRYGNVINDLPTLAALVDGELVSDGKFNTSDYIKVNAGDVVFYSGFCGNNTVNAIYGYDNAKNKVSSLINGGYSGYLNANIVIPNGISYIRICAANTNHTRYIPVSISIQTNIKRITQLEQNNIELNEQVTFEEFEFVGLGYYRPAFWTESGNIKAGKYILDLPNLTSVKTASAQSASTVLREIEFIAVGNLFEFEITNEDINSGAHYLRVQSSDSSIETATLRYLSAVKTNKEVVNELILKTSSLPNLNGKKIAVIGDSISTIYNGNTPYWTVKTIDVGQEIESYVTWWDVWTNEEGTTPTGKTIGGVTLTSAMIGTKQSFTPVLADVGKQIGVAMNYNSSSTKVWSQWLCEKTGAILLANASWSGSRITTGRTGAWELSEAWNDYTIGRCKVRDDDGNNVTPDIIFIFRGGNDYQYAPKALINDVSLMNGVPASDVISSQIEYKAGYYLTIQKLRQAYPNAYIVCCALSFIKRGSDYSKFPPNNSIYTLPDMCNAIREIANTMGCGLVEFDKDGITFENCYPKYISDDATHPTHPNSLGHEVMAERAISDLRYCLNH